jgi:hypothetical protein
MLVEIQTDTINIGDRVKLIEPGGIYTRYINFFKSDEIGVMQRNMFALKEYPNRNTVLRVVDKAPHRKVNSIMVYVLLDEERGKIYLSSNTYKNIIVVVDRITPDDFYKKIISG